MDPDQKITVTIQVGNSDNKLRQSDWSHFVHMVKHDVEKYAHEVHFFGGSETYAPWQNVCWVILITERHAETLRTVLWETAKSYKQDSIAWLQGHVEMLNSDPIEQNMRDVSAQSGECF